MVEYKNFSVIKMGCNKCTEVFYSKGGYNDHLFHKHKIKNVSQVSTNNFEYDLATLPKPKESEEMRYSCPKCGTKFFKYHAVETHEQYCYKLSAEDKEARA